MTIVVFIGKFVQVLGNLLTFAIIIRVIMSWFSMGRPGAVGGFGALINDVTDPVINLAKKIPHQIGMIDLSPIIALFAIDILVRVIFIFLNSVVA